jgi:crotonobetainyl-CoA:carnitine CoA-transferase CaiB-like acyl-CoA transferase
MTDENNKTGMLSPYRVLDLADEKGLLSGKLLGDLGADVIKVEKPGGDPSRYIGPFYHDEVHPEKSLFWFAYNASKRGITLNIDVDEGKDIFKQLVKKSDFIIESFKPGFLDGIGLGYTEIEKLNPGIIMISISPFGQNGPHAAYEADDLVIWAMSGRMYSLGDAERPPIQISHIMQTYLQAGLEGAMAATLALYHRRMTGEGQHIDLSIQSAAAQPGQMNWDLNQQVAPRRSQSQGRLANPRINLTRAWPCKDGGLISWIYMPGTYDGGTRNLGLIKCLAPMTAVLETWD